VEVLPMLSFWLLINYAFYILAIVFFVYGILAFRKYLKSDQNASKNEKPEVG
jgi:heme/copper-type cytochrome/quinol oxidase subunit 2